MRDAFRHVTENIAHRMRSYSFVGGYCPLLLPGARESGTGGQCPPYYGVQSSEPSTTVWLRPPTQIALPSICTINRASWPISRPWLTW